MEKEIKKNQAPNMVVAYPDSGNYDLVMVDWYCETDASNTYWAVHQFSTNTVDGYAGFQNAGNNHVLMFSIWDHGTNYPVVEYVSSSTQLNNLNFGGEGTGKHIVTNFDWKVGKWYTMCIGTKTIAGKTYYAQWVAEKDSKDWFLCGIISYPVPNRYIGSDLMFQEDFRFNNLKKRCRLQNAFGRFNGKEVWHCWNQYVISNNFYRYTDTVTPISNFKYDCECGVDPTKTYIYVQSGGEDLLNSELVEREMVLPYNASLRSSSKPSSSPSWAQLAPRWIKSKYNGLYIAPGKNNTVVQSKEPYYWNFVDSADGYFYILSEDRSLAITITGKASGSDLILADFKRLDTQKWTNQSVQQSEYVYFYPKEALNMNIDIEGPSFEEGTPLQLWEHGIEKQFMWLSLNKSTHHVIKSYFSKLYVSHSNEKIVQSANAQKWNFIPAGGEYFYILSLDNTKAITVNGTYDGADLIYSDFNPGDDNQKWKLLDAGNQRYYLIPKSDEKRNMDIEGPVGTEGANIQIWTHQQGINQFQWYIE